MCISTYRSHIILLNGPVVHCTVVQSMLDLVHTKNWGSSKLDKKALEYP